MPKTSAEYKNLTLEEFTKAARIYEKKNAGIYKVCRKDYPDILEELEREPFEDLLDAGCGPGSMIAILAESIPGKRYVGVDLAPAMIEAARRKNLPGAKFVVGDCENLPFPPESFDVMLCANSAHHYPNVEGFYQSVHRCLRPGGRLILRDFTSDSPVVRWLATHVEMPLAHVCGRGHAAPGRCATRSRSRWHERGEQRDSQGRSTPPGGAQAQARCLLRTQEGHLSVTLSTGMAERAQFPHLFT